MEHLKASYSKDELAQMRDQFPHLDSYEAWVAAGKPQPVHLWPNDPPEPEPDRAGVVQMYAMLMAARWVLGTNVQREADRAVTWLFVSEGRAS